MKQRWLRITFVCILTGMIGGRIAMADWGTVSYDLSGTGQARLENSVFTIIMGKKTFGDGAVNFVITQFMVKAKGVNMGGDQIDGIWMGYGKGRGDLTKGQVTYDGADKKTLYLEWNNGAVKQSYTIYPDCPVIKINYLSYGVNVVDIGNPGGGSSGIYKFYGAESWIRGYVAYPESYYNAPESGDPANGGSLNYNGHFIMGIVNAANSTGFGRVSPVEASRIIKLLFNRGFEQFPYFSASKKPYTQYLFVVTAGFNEVITLGQAIADGNFLQQVTDTTPPTITSVSTGTDPNQVVVQFSEYVDQTSARTTGNYSISDAITVSGASLGSDGRTVTLTTSALAEKTYTLTVNNVKDLKGNTIAANSQKTFTYVEFKGWADDFNDGNYTGWTVGEGSWSVTGGKLQNTGSGRTSIWAGEAGWTDITYTADITPATGADAWIIFRVQDQSNYYLFTLDGKALYKLVNGSFQSIKEAGGSFATGNTYTIKVELAGSSIKIYEGTSLILSATDPQFSSGKVGFGSSNSQAGFDNVKVEGTMVTGIKSLSLQPPVKTDRLRAGRIYDLKGNHISSYKGTGIYFTRSGQDGRLVKMMVIE